MDASGILRAERLRDGCDVAGAEVDVAVPAEVAVNLVYATLPHAVMMATPISRISRAASA